MLQEAKADRRWSDVGLNALIVSFVLAIVLSVGDGLLRGAMEANRTPSIYMFDFWVMDFRYVSEQVMLVAIILFVGAKFFETRTVLTIAFDKLDADKMSFKGPDENNVIWIGRRYGSRFEAEAVAATLEERLKESTL